MKFFAVAALIATIQAQTVCTDDDFGDVCPDGACCGYLQPAAGDATRACSDGDQTSPDGDYAGEDVFTCDAPIAEEEGASKVILGAASLLAAVMMA